MAAIRGKGSKSSSILASFRNDAKSLSVAVLARESVAAFLTIHDLSSHEDISNSIACWSPFSAIFAMPTTAARRTDSCQSSKRGAIKSTASRLPRGTREAMALIADSRTVPIWSSKSLRAAAMASALLCWARWAMVSMAARRTPQSSSSRHSFTAASTSRSNGVPRVGWPAAPVMSASVLSPAMRVHSQVLLQRSSVALTVRVSPMSATFAMAACAESCTATSSSPRPRAIAWMASSSLRYLPRFLMALRLTGTSWCFASLRSSSFGGGGGFSFTSLPQKPRPGRGKACSRWSRAGRAAAVLPRPPADATAKWHLASCTNCSEALGATRPAVRQPLRRHMVLLASAQTRQESHRAAAALSHSNA
mmetsp:Transcript_10555/g.32896  ORF Transcript_10555/g.32896 Transcript_10555/m.32896 type:complete len:364 (+) Transcript_10555:466-1557(+)